MSKFVFVFRGGIPESPEDGQKLMAVWGDWLAGMDGAVVDTGAMVGQSIFLDAEGKQGARGDAISGYMVIEAADSDAAVQHAQACPIFSRGGRIEIAPAMGT